jgi:hypothetical protein
MCKTLLFQLRNDHKEGKQLLLTLVAVATRPCGEHSLVVVMTLMSRNLIAHFRLHAALVCHLVAYYVRIIISLLIFLN